MTIEEYSFVSADGHVVEPAELWLTRMDKKYRARAPHVESRDDADYYVLDGLAPFPVGLEGATMDDKIRGEISSVVGHPHGDTRPGILKHGLKISSWTTCGQR